MVLLIVLVSFAVILATGASIGVGLGLASAAGLFFGEHMPPLLVIVQRMFTSVDSFSFMAVPFFMLAGAFMSDGGVTKRIVDFSMSLVGSLSEMEKRGYPRAFAAAVVAAGGTVGIIIPPSITMVVYGSIANVSVADLFMAGFAPGILMGITMCIVSWFISKKNGYSGEGSFSIIKVAKSFKECFWALMMPVIILGGIYLGLFTPTEAAAVAAVYGAVVGLFIYKELKWSDLPKTLLSAAYNTTMIMFVVGAANLFGWILTNAHVPHMLAEFFASVTDNKFVFLMMINVLLLIIGTLVNASAAVVILQLLSAWESILCSSVC